MKLDVYENKALNLTGTQPTQNENNVQNIEITVPEKYKDFNKKIVFILGDKVEWDFIPENNLYPITRKISKYKYVQFYIWLTKSNVDESNEDHNVVEIKDGDFRSITKELRFNENQDASDQISDEEIGAVNKVINLLEEEIIKVENLDLDIEKVGNKSTVTITKKDGSKKSVEIYDGQSGTGGGTSNYNDLLNKPSINDVELSGNKTLEELGIQAKGNYIEDSNYVHTDNNYTNEDKEKLDNVRNYDDTELRNEIDSKANKTDLHNHANKDILDNITSENINSWNNKSDFDGDYNNLSNLPIIPNKTSELKNDSDFITKAYVDGLLGEINTELSTLTTVGGGE